MNLLLFSESELTPTGFVVLRGRRAEHLRRVLKVSVGQTLRAGVVRKGTLEVVVRSVDPEQIRLEPLLSGMTPAAPPTHELILALPRPKALGRILQAAASFGLRRIDVVNAWRVDAAYFDSPKLCADALTEQLWLGCEQGRQTYLPDIAVHRFLLPFLHQGWGERQQREPERLLVVGHPSAPQDLEDVVLAQAGVPITVFVGPDGGFVESELLTLAELGARPVRLGSAILRTEVAVVALLSQLLLLERMKRNGRFLPQGSGGAG